MDSEIFSPYHNFPNSAIFHNAYSDLNNRHKVAGTCTAIPRHHQSVLMKLQRARQHLEDVISIENWDASLFVHVPPTGSSGTISYGTSSAVSATNYTPAVHPLTVRVSGDLDDFFCNLFSALDVLAQVINLIYFDPPYNEADVAFWFIGDKLSRSSKQNERITHAIQNVQTEQWFQEVKPFRKCATHRNSIMFKVETEFEPLQLFQSQKVTAIVLADDPFASPPSYARKRNIESYGINILSDFLRTIDSLFEIMEQRIRTADSIPI